VEGPAEGDRSVDRRRIDEEIRMRTRSALTAAGAIAAVAALTGGAAVPGASPAPDDAASLHEQLWSAPAEAVAGPTARHAGDRDLAAALDALVADGAIGITARVEVGERVWADAAGTRGLDRRPPALPHSPFRAASNLKTMIAVLVLQEVEAGTWSLDTAIGDIVPGLLPGHPQTTLRQLLSHTGGTPYGSDVLLASHLDDATSGEEALAALGDRYPDVEHIAAANAGEWGPPGEFVYSNVAYVALGVALEAVTGQEVEALLEERIWDPLGMRSTTYPDGPGMRGTALGEAMWDGVAWHDLGHFHPSYFSHAGAVSSTTEDLSRFMEALMTGELVAPELVDAMVQPESTDPMEYGLGILRVPDPCVPGGYLYGNEGGSMGTISLMLSSPDGERQLSFAVTGRDMSGGPEPLYDVAPMVAGLVTASCG
jgi:D-alanyl-D-alanine carboxypeptidase